MAQSNGSQRRDADERHVLVIITGGTICMQDSPDGLIPTGNFAQNLLLPNPEFHDGSATSEARPVVNEQGESRPSVNIHPPPQSEDLPNYNCTVLEFEDLIDSSSMNETHWNKIATTLVRNWATFDAFVILHGTDTLAYTASALSFMLGQTNKTVIITGSQLSMYAPHNDAYDNLLDSLTLAASFDIPEVGVVFHHHLYRATRVTKVSAFSMAAFTTPNAKPLATIRHGKTWAAALHLDTIRPVSAGAIGKASFTNVSTASPDSFGTLDTARVAVLKVYPGISSNLISHIAHIPNLGGLVLETFGAGNVPLGTGDRDLLHILSSAVNQGIVVVSVTQCLTGSVTSAYESARRMERNGIVTGLDMTTEAAYTKLVYLLSNPVASPTGVAEQMRQNLRGELTADFREGQRRRDSISRGTVAA